MKKLLILPLIALCFLTMSIKPAEASPAALFVFTGLIGGWTAVTYEDCKSEGIGAKNCAKKTWRERTDVPITQKLYKQIYND